MSIKKLKTIPLATEVVAENYFADMAKDGLFLLVNTVYLNWKIGRMG